MQTILRLIKAPRSPFIFALLVGFGMFSTGVVLGHVMRLAACPLCILQRMLYLTLGLSAVLGLLVWQYRAGRVISSLLMVASAGCGVFVAGYQTYIQRFAHDVQCSGEAAWWELFVDWAGERAPLLFHASGLCSDPAWKLMSLSIAEWSLIAFIVLTPLTLYALFCSALRNSPR
jgi:disulfide bond formation protein DsbB